MAQSAVNKIGETYGAGSSQTTAATLTPVAGRLYLAAVTSAFAGGGNTPTMSGGGGLTWVQVATRLQGNARLTVFRALKTSGLTSGTLTIDWAGQSQSNSSIIVDEISGVNQSGADGAGAIVQSAVNSAASGTTGSTTLAAFADATNNGAWAATHHVFNEVTAPEAGWTELKDIMSAAVGGLETEWRLGGDTSPTTTWANSAVWDMISVEIDVPRLGSILTETDTPLAPTKTKQKDIAILTETDAPLAPTKTKQRDISLLSEVDSLFLLTRVLSILSETDA